MQKIKDKGVTASAFQTDSCPNLGPANSLTNQWDPSSSSSPSAESGFLSARSPTPLVRPVHLGATPRSHGAPACELGERRAPSTALCGDAEPGPARACRVLEQTPCDGRPRPRSPCAPRCAPFGPRRRSARPAPAELTHLERAGARSLTRREPGPPHPRNGELPPAALGRLLPGQCDRSGGSPARGGAEPRRLFPAPTRALRAHTNDRRDARTFASDSGRLPHSPREVPPPRRLHGGHLARCLTTPFDSRANP